MTWIYGTSDPILTEKRLDFIRGVIREQQLDFEEKTFAGKHEMTREVLKSLF